MTRWEVRSSFLKRHRTTKDWLGPETGMKVERLTDGDLTRLAASVPFHDYKSLRPDTSPYGPWRKNAIAGTLTDDSRHKIVLIHAMARVTNKAV